MLSTNNIYLNSIKNHLTSYYNQYNRYPHKRSGLIPNTNQTWKSVDSAFYRRKKLDGVYTSLADFIKKEILTPVANPYNFNLKDIKGWVKRYLKNRDKYPSKNSGKIKNVEATWRAVDHAFTRGHRGLGNSGYKSLAHYIDEVFRKPRVKLTPALTKSGLISKSKLFREDFHFDRVKLYYMIEDYFTKYNMLPYIYDNFIDGTAIEWIDIDTYINFGYKGLEQYKSLDHFIKENFPWHKQYLKEKRERSYHFKLVELED